MSSTRATRIKLCVLIVGVVVLITGIQWWSHPQSTAATEAPTRVADKPTPEKGESAEHSAVRVPRAAEELGGETVSASTKGFLTLTVIDESGRPIAAARARIRYWNDVVDEGVSDNSGNVHLTLPSECRLSHVDVSAEGYASVFESLQEPLPAAHCVVMHAAGTIKGIVRTTAGNAVSGLLVFAVPEGEFPQSFVAEDLLSQNSYVPSTKTDQEGRFLLSGISPHSRRSLHAVGRGYSTDMRGMSAGAAYRDNNDGVVIVVKRKYMVDLVLESKGGAPLELSNKVFGRQWSIQPRPLSEGVRLALYSPGLLDLLSGSPRFQQRHGPDRYGDVYLFDADDETLQALPMKVRLMLPGYHEYDAVIDATPMDAGLREVTLELVPNGDGFGIVQLDLRACAQEFLKFKDWGIVEMRSASGAANISIAIEEGGGLVQSIVGIPSGGYSALLRPSFGGKIEFAGNPTIDVRPNQVVSLVALPVNSGELTLELEDVNGQTHDGVVAGILSGRDRRNTHLVTLTARPYVIAGLQPDEYVFTMMAPLHLPAGIDLLGQVPPVHVESGKRSTMKIHLDLQAK